MIHTQIIPDSNQVSVVIPDSYIGKKVELILFSEDDLQGNTKAIGGIKKYKGMLSKERAYEFQQFAAQIREEWSKEI